MKPLASEPRRSSVIGLVFKPRCLAPGSTVLSTRESERFLSACGLPRLSLLLSECWSLSFVCEQWEGGCSEPPLSIQGRREPLCSRMYVYNVAGLGGDHVGCPITWPSLGHRLLWQMLAL